MADTGDTGPLTNIDLIICNWLIAATGKYHNYVHIRNYCPYSLNIYNYIYIYLYGSAI